MNKKQVLEKFKDDFDKTRGALNEIISHNRGIDINLVEDLKIGNFKLLEEHVEIQKLILEATKGMTSLYKETAGILKATNELEEAKEEKSKINIEDLMKD